MKKNIFYIIVMLIIGNDLKAQDTINTISGLRNSIKFDVGLLDLNLNYERTIIQGSRSFSNLRLGFGAGWFAIKSESAGVYFNGAFVHLTGRKNSHMEIDLGAKYLFKNAISDPNISEIIIPDIFFGYRFEKPTGGFISRVGFCYPTMINVGIGGKF